MKPTVSTPDPADEGYQFVRKRVSSHNLNNGLPSPLLNIPDADSTPPSSPSGRIPRKRRSAQNLRKDQSEDIQANGDDMATTSGVVHASHRASRRSESISMLRVGDEEELRMGLLSPTRAVADGNESDDSLDQKRANAPMSLKDKYAVALLVLLYLIQGVPIGLAFGSIPFLLKSKLSYSQIGTFSLCTFPYSLKLLHAPVVDAVFSTRLGRRKSWIVPIQIIMGCLMIWMGRNIADLIEVEHPPIAYITFLFTLLIFFAATQDIAVDGWALTLLSQENLSFASTAQTAGLNSGYFLSFTVFLALNSPDFANKYFREIPDEAPLLSLAGYMTFWGFASLAVSLWLFIFKKEDPVAGDADDLYLTRVYKSMWSVCKLKHVQLLCMVHLVSKIGFQANEAVTSLKLVEKGLGKEDLAIVVLIDFPFQIIGGWLAARWSMGDKALRPWIWGFWARLGFAVFYMFVVWIFPRPPIPASFFLLLIVSNVLSGFAGTVQFVGVSAFHTQIADPVIGGTYMTLLNTISNLGGTWPRFFVLRGVDAFTIATCQFTTMLTSEATAVSGNECVSEDGKSACAAAGGTCVIERDGYYWMSTICVALGTLILVFFVLPTARHLQSLPLSKWRLKQQ